MTPVDDPTVICWVNIGLGTKFETEILDNVGSRACKRRSNATKVDNDCLDAVTFSLDFGLYPFHLVAIEGVGDIATDVDERHFGGIVTLKAIGRSWQRFGNRAMVLLAGEDGYLGTRHAREKIL